MKKPKRIKQFKIVEQIAFIVLFSVLIPLSITGIIVNNINQHAVRKELSYSAKMIAEVVAKNIQIYSAIDPDLKESSDNILSIFKTDKRQIYIIDGDTRDLIISGNITQNEYKDSIKN